MVRVNRDSFTLLSGSEDVISDQAALNIIFVHGLRGHPRDTWTASSDSNKDTEGEPGSDTASRRKGLKSIFALRKVKAKPTEPGAPRPPTSSDVFWPEQYLVPDIPSARVWTYGYNADVIGGLFQSNNKNSVSQHGRDFAVRLDREIDNEDSIVFVAHSLGGIIVKDALHRSKRCRDRTKFIVFLGTPHRGSGYAGWGEIASNLARLGLQDSNKRILETLEVNGEVLDNIHEEFKSIVVDDFSSKLDLPGAQETVESIDANHMQMAQCRSRDDPRYRAISGVLKQFLRKEVFMKATAPVDPVRSESLSVHKSLFLVPFDRDNSFIGREDILADIEKANERATGPKHSRVALVGLGGIGKSQIAIEYGYRTHERDPETSVFWIHASSASRFQQGYREIAETADLPGRDEPQVNVLQLVCGWLSDGANGEWLMVLDNADDDVFFRRDEGVGGNVAESQRVDRQQPLETFLPRSRNGSILITSRNSTAARNLVGSYGSIIDVEPMAEPEALALLESRVALDDASRGDARELVQALEWIPLAITHAASYIRNRQRITISVYLHLFRESEANQASLLNNSEAEDLRRDHSIRHPVITTWQITFDQIRRSTPAATELLALMSMFDRQGIPECLLHNGADRLRFEDAIAPLLNFSLVREQSGKGSFEMHRLVQLSTRKWLEVKNELPKWTKGAIRIMAEEFPNGTFETWSLCLVLLPHAKVVLAYEETDEEDALNLAKVGNNTGWYLVEKGEYKAGEMILRETLQTREKVLGPERPDTLASLNSLASVLMSQGKYDEAEQLHRRALDGREKVLGTEHPDTLESVNDLASVLMSQGKYGEAEQLHRRALDGREKVLGTEHPDTLESVNDLASVLMSQGKYNEAEQLYRRALDGRKKVLGTEHPATLTSVNNLASVLISQGKYDEAEQLHRRALDRRETVLGPEHPATVTSVNNLASVLISQGKYNEAEQLHRRALDGRETVLGPEHPATLTSVNNLASALENQGKYDEAEQLYRRALDRRETVLGPEHPDTLASLNNLALGLVRRGKYDEAEQLHRRALDGYKKVLRPEHPHTLTSVNNLAFVLESQGKYDEAEQLHRRALDGREKMLGPKHPDTPTSVNNLALVLVKQGKYNEAEQLHRQALDGCKEVLGPEHPYTLTSLSNLASVLMRQGEYNEAEQIYRQALDGYKKVLGPEHPTTLVSLNNLASVLMSQGKYNEAEQLHRRALDKKEKVLGTEHPATLTSVNNLAAALESQGKYEEAEQLHCRALDGFEKVLGPEHPDTLTSVGHLASVLVRQEKYDEAEQLRRRALDGFEKVLGPEHPDTLTSLYCLAYLLQTQTQYDAAADLYRRACNGYKATLGSGHPTTVACSKHYARMLQEWGRVDST